MKIHTRPDAQRGFTLVELTIATAVLLFGVVAVMQLVPVAMESNLRNRYDTTSMVVAQRLLDQMMSQPVEATSFIDADGNVRQLGGLPTATTIYGGPVTQVNKVARINFSPAAVANYNFVYIDPNDPARVPYEVRWAVVVVPQSGVVASKRFIVGAWRRDPRRITLPVTVEGWLQR
jgi:prepilin-type N-terminal cleavage/methylation domain-containing protein